MKRLCSVCYKPRNEDNIIQTTTGELASLRMRYTTENCAFTIHNSSDVVYLCMWCYKEITGRDL